MVRTLPSRSTIACLVLLGAAAFLSAGFATGRTGFATSAYRAERLDAITAALAGVEGNYVLAIGDSHILRWKVQELCGLPLINAGIDGATSEDIASLLEALDLPRPPRAVVVTIGTNDTYRKRAATAEMAVARFQAGFDEVLGALASRSHPILVNAPPPLDEQRDPRFWAEAIAPIGAAAAAACRGASRCRFQTPFGPATPLAADGVHLRDYDAAYGSVEAAACAVIRAPRLVSATVAP